MTRFWLEPGTARTRCHRSPTPTDRRRLREDPRTPPNVRTPGRRGSPDRLGWSRRSRQPYAPSVDTYRLYQTLTSYPLGRTLFSLAYGIKAPYFATVRPDVLVMRENYAEVVVAQRRSVRNHIGTVHAIAICNGLEAAMGLVAEATCPPAWRWIPRGMTVSYLAKADSDILCIAETNPDQWDTPGDIDVRVRAEKRDGTVVVDGTITIYVSQRPARA